MGLRVAIAAPLVATISATMGIPLLAVGGGADTLPTAPAGAHRAVPERALRAYLASHGACPGLRWELLAGIGWIESRHATRGAALDPATGEATPWIFGPPLDGSHDTERHAVGAHLWYWGLTGPYEQALGPMQFRPGTFAAWAVDSDGDDIANPHDIDDAVATAARYLCGISDSVDDERDALSRYNADAAYITDVLTYADGLALPAVVGGAGFLCPVAGPTSFTDTWGAPRSGGRRHRGVDMFAARGTPVVAPVAGVASHYHDRLGGLSFRLFGDDGHYYYGTHLAAYGPATGHVPAGTVLGYVGDTGNAAGTGTHLHFEIHPNRHPGQPPNPVNPTPTVEAACRDQRVGVAPVGGD